MSKGEVNNLQKMLLVYTDILPEIFLKVIEVKRLIRHKKAKNVTEATKKVGISRSTYYKYRDYVHEISDKVVSKKATIEVLLNHKAGMLSSILDILAKYKFNIITINQTVPINGIASVTVTVDMTEVEIEMEKLILILSKRKGVLEVKLLAME